MSEVINVTDKFLKCKLKMSSVNEQLWHREQMSGDSLVYRKDTGLKTRLKTTL